MVEALVIVLGIFLAVPGSVPPRAAPPAQSESAPKVEPKKDPAVADMPKKKSLKKAKGSKMEKAKADE